MTKVIVLTYCMYYICVSFNQLIIHIMRTKKQVILYFDTVDQCKEGIIFLCNMHIVFDCLKYKYVRISQKAFKQCDCIDLYTGCTNVFSSII